MARWSVYSKGVTAELAQLRYHRDISGTELIRNKGTQKFDYTNFRSVCSYFWLVPLLLFIAKSKKLSYLHT